MILAIDIGNTTVTLGGVRTAPQQAYSLEFTARIDIDRTWSASQYEAAIGQLFENEALSPSDFRGVIISSVVPPVLTFLQECVRHLFGVEPLLVTSESDLGMTFSIPEPERVGRDRLVDAAWAAAHYPLPVITVDLGTGSWAVRSERALSPMSSPGAMTPPQKTLFSRMTLNVVAVPRSTVMTGSG